MIKGANVRWSIFSSDENRVSPSQGMAKLADCELPFVSLSAAAFSLRSTSASLSDIHAVWIIRRLTQNVQDRRCRKRIAPVGDQSQAGKGNRAFPRCQKARALDEIGYSDLLKSVADSLQLPICSTQHSNVTQPNTLGVALRDAASNCQRIVSLILRLEDPSLDASRYGVLDWGS